MKHLKAWLLNGVHSGGYSGYSWTSQKSDRKIITSYDPATEKKIGAIAGVTIADYDVIMQQALHAFSVWRSVPAPKRGEVIREIGEVLRQHQEKLSTLIALEVGKSIQEAAGEVQEMIDMAAFAVGQSRMLYGKTMQSERPNHRLFEQWHPLGVIGIISAFNFPVAVWAWNAFLGAICGNVMLWKPSRRGALCAIYVHRLCAEVLKAKQLPAIFSLIIPAEREVTNAMLQDTRMPLISFTGSTEVGRNVASTVAKRFGKTILELGGNNAVIIDETADLALATEAVIFGAIGTSGQRCTSTRRLFIQQSVYHDMIARLKAAYADIKIGSPFNQKCLMGPLIHREALLMYERTLNEIKEAGGHIIFGGNVLKRKGHFVAPTLVTNLDNAHPLVQRETFAPILYLIPFQVLSDAIQLQNAVPQGLSSALFTRQFNHAEHFLSVSGSDCGIANINVGTSGAEIGGAFGGEKETGGGREAGSDAWKAYMRRQTNTLNWGDSLPHAQGIIFS